MKWIHHFTLQLLHSCRSQTTLNCLRHANVYIMLYSITLKEKERRTGGKNKKHAIIELCGADVEGGRSQTDKFSTCVSVTLTFTVVCWVLLLLIIRAQYLFLRLCRPCQLRWRWRRRRGRGRGTNRGFLLGFRPVNTTLKQNLANLTCIAWFLCFELWLTRTTVDWALREDDSFQS